MGKRNVSSHALKFFYKKDIFHLREPLIILLSLAVAWPRITGDIGIDISGDTHCKWRASENPK